MKFENPIIPFLRQQGVLVLDGGLATELEARGCDLNNPLWSAALLIDRPDLIRQLHLDYLEAGADCITSASYQASIPGFRQWGLSEERAEQLLLLSVELAVEARNHFWSRAENRGGRLRPLVAASIGPYGAFLADGSEYSGDYRIDDKGLRSFHCRRWQLLAGSRADLLACETIPSRQEGRVLLQMLRETPGRMAWFSFSCQDGEHLYDGSRLVEVADDLAAEEQVAAVGVNCTAPRFVPNLINQVKNTGKPVIVYPNSGETYDAAGKTWSGVRDPYDFAHSSSDFFSRGARLIGGCCRTGPRHIREIRRALLAG